MPDRRQFVAGTADTARVPLDLLQPVGGGRIAARAA